MANTINHLHQQGGATVSPVDTLTSHFAKLANRVQRPLTQHAPQVPSFVAGQTFGAKPTSITQQGRMSALPIL